MLVATLLAAASASAGPFFAGADISALPVLEGAGAVYYDGTQSGDAIEILKDHGVSYYRLRLFVSPAGSPDPFVVQDLAYTVALAQRVKAAGGKLLLDFHYSDTWADPGTQSKPAAWAGLTGVPLQQQVYNYTRDSVAAFAAAGVTPEIVQIGNEVSNGLLWNDGYPWSGGSNDAGFNRLAALLRAGIDGAKAGAPPGQEPLVMIHHDKGAEWSTTSYFFNKLVQRGVDFDLIGYSYYPKFHYDPVTGTGDVADVITNLHNTATTFNKPVILAEVGFPSRGASFEPDYEFDVSAAGQRAYLQALVDALLTTPNGLGWGAFWWNADARPVAGLPVWEGGRYGLFDQSGRLLPAAEVFASLPSSVDGDYNGDGAADAADYTVWRDSLGQLVSAGAGADGDFDGVVDAGDFVRWRAHYGDGPALNSIPEPTALVVAAFSIVASLLIRVRPTPGSNDGARPK